MSLSSGSACQDQDRADELQELRRRPEGGEHQDDRRRTDRGMSLLRDDLPACRRTQVVAALHKENSMLRRLFSLFLVLGLAALLVTPAAAQSYDFSMDKVDANVYWNEDGTLSLDYLLTFTNQPGGHVIDFVDVGLPTNTFDINAVQADVNGNPLNISSDFQGPSGYGVAVEMGPYAIQPGGTGTLHVRADNIPGVLYNDDNDSNYASAAFAPLYYQGNVISGNTDMTVTYHLPPGVQPDEPRWHAAPDNFPSEPQTGIDPQGRVTYTWNNPSADGSAAVPCSAPPSRSNMSRLAASRRNTRRRPPPCHRFPSHSGRSSTACASPFLDLCSWACRS